MPALIVSNPVMNPKIPKYGVQVCAGIISISFEIFIISSTNLSQEMLKIGLPS